MHTRGMTIIEAVVSICIVSFVLIGMIRFCSLGAIQSEIARHKIMALNLCQAEIESLRNTSYENIILSNYPLTKIVKIDRGKTNQTSDDIDGTMVTQIPSMPEGYKIIVTVSWNDYYGAMSEVLESLITSYL